MGKPRRTKLGPEPIPPNRNRTVLSQSPRPSLVTGLGSGSMDAYH